MCAAAPTAENMNLKYKGMIMNVTDERMTKVVIYGLLKYTILSCFCHHINVMFNFQIIYQAKYVHMHACMNHIMKTCETVRRHYL